MTQKANNSSNSLWHWGIAAVVAFGFIVYLRLYFSQYLVPGFPNAGTRAVLFFRALIPDTLVQDWTADGKLPFGLLDRVPLWLAAAFWYGLAWWIGDVLLKRLGLMPLSRETNPSQWLAVRHPLAIALGLGMLSLTTFLVGCMGLLKAPWAMMVAIAIWIAVGVVSCLTGKKCEALPALSAAGMEDSTVSSLTLRFMQLFQIAFFACCFYYSICSAMAPVEFDVLEYHLQAPKEFWQQGAISFLPHNVYANMPLGIEMHALAWMTLVSGSDGWWWGALIGKVIIGWMAPLTAWLLAASLFEYCKRQRADESERGHATLISLGGAVLYLTLPGIAEVSQFGQIDAALGLYVLATVVVAFHYSFGNSEEHRSTTAVLLGLFAGMAFSAKYPALMFAIVPAVVVLLVRECRTPILAKQLTTRLLLFAAGVLIAAGPWLLKNAVVSGNPVYPLAASVLGGRTLDAEKIEQWQKAHAIPAIKDAQGNEVRFSWKQAIASLEQLAYKSPIPSSIFVPMFLLGAFYLPRRETWWWLAWLTAGLAVWWFMSHRLDRFWLPLLPIAAWLAARAIMPLFQTAAGIPLAVVMTIGVLHSFLFFASPPANDPRYLVSLDAQRTDWKGEEFTRVSQAIGWINDNLKTTDRILMVGQAAVFDVAVPCDYSTCFDDSKWDEVAKATSPAERLQKFKELGVTYVCIHWGEIERYRSPGNYGFRSMITQPQVAEFISSGVLSVVETGQDMNGVSLLKVKENLAL